MKDALGFVVISQDDMGSKKACFNAFSAAYKSGNRIIVDRCNPTIEARAEWIGMAFGTASAVCIHFEYPAELCRQRADARPSHPTIVQGRSRGIIRSFEKQFQQPSLQEKFSCVCVVRSITAANELAARLGVRQGSTSEDKKESKHIYKFPRTRHLFNLGAATRDDLILTPTDSASFLDTSDGSIISVEEKVDGANMGISIDPLLMTFRVQNRSHYVNSKSQEQFRKLDKWLQDHSQDLYVILNESQPGRYILYGEWMYAKHSIPYSRLPDYFIAFDLFDTETERFIARSLLSDKLAGTNIHQVPRVDLADSIRLDERTLRDTVLNTKSSFYDGVVEGFYLRKDRDGYLADRAKIVRKDFIAGNEHWNKGALTVNGLRSHST